MTEASFIPKNYSNSLKEGNITWQSPSNIALVKYWGKHGEQLPLNPSISFTLDASKTITELKFQLKEDPSNIFDFEVYFDGNKSEDFRSKIEIFFDRAEIYLPFLKKYRFEIHTSNTFPHSSGIASSASGMSALALCLTSIEKQLLSDSTDKDFIEKASFIARLGSGSACRSIEGDLIVWGKHSNIEGSSDLFGIKYPYRVHKTFKNYQDTILLVDRSEKRVSSTVGHNLMNNHPFAKARFQQANDNISKLKNVFKTGDLKSFIAIVENEALTLHGLMMTSMPNFILMKPNTLKIISGIRKFRRETGSNLCFTLDAGANVHVLYPTIEKDAVLKFIKNELVAYCQDGQYICDRIGYGAKKM